jgi:outer membrane protein TolC
MFEQQKNAASRCEQAVRRQAGRQLCAVAAVLLVWAAAISSGYAQQVPGAGANAPEKAASELPSAPPVVLTEPVNLRPSLRDFSKPAGRFLGNPINMYRPTSIGKASFSNSVRLTDLVKDGKIYLSLSDALALALENNYDIAIARYDLDIADTDLLRTRTGAQPLGAPSGLITGTLGGSPTILTTGGGPGGTTVGSGGAGSGTAGLTLTTAGAGPTPESLEPSVMGAIQFDRAHSPSTNFISGGTSTTNTYNAVYNQGFVTGTQLQFGFNNSYAATSNGVTLYSPQLSSNFKATLTQHLLNGAGIWVNKRFIYQAQNNRRITDASFRQQILYTVNQVETIYWGLVQAYEDVQAKQRALAQSTKLASDDRKQLEVGSVAPLTVVQDDSIVNSDKQALIAAQSNLNYQQQVIKQAVARNLNDAVLSVAPVIPTDRVTIEEIPEEKQPVEELVQEAFQQRPELEEAVLALRNDEITLKGARRGLLPIFDVFGYMAGQGIAGSINPKLDCSFYAAGQCPTSNSSLLTTKPGVYTYVAPTTYGTALNGAFNDSAPDKGVGFSISIPLGNKYAQSVQERSLMEYRQAELRLEQLYTQIRMQVVNAQYALINDRAQVQAAIAAREYNRQNVDAEQTKLRYGSSTTATVMLQERSLATAEDNLIAARAAYAKDRAGLYQMLASTLQHYGINLNEAASGVVKTAPVVPGVSPAKDTTGPVTNPSANPATNPPATQ